MTIYLGFRSPYSSRSRSTSQSPAAKRKYRDSPVKKYRKEGHISGSDKNRSRHKNRHHSVSPHSRSRSVERSPSHKYKKTLKKHRSRSKSMERNRHSKINRYRSRSRSRERTRKSKKHNGHRRSRSRDRYRRWTVTRSVWCSQHVGNLWMNMKEILMSSCYFTSCIRKKRNFYFVWRV